MCIAIYKPGDQPPMSWQHLYNSFKENPDGAGFMFIDATRKGLERLRVHKGFMSFNHFYSSYSRWQALCPKSPFVLHCRWATHGLRDKTMCHPFELKAGIAYVHNGVFSMPTQHYNPFPKARGPHTWESDTCYYAEVYFKYFGMKSFSDPKWKHETEEWLGKSNKLVIMDWQGKVEIYNEDQGYWSGGSWYSNLNFRDTLGYSKSDYARWGWSAEDSRYVEAKPTYRDAVNDHTRKADTTTADKEEKSCRGEPCKCCSDTWNCRANSDVREYSDEQINVSLKHGEEKIQEAAKEAAKAFTTRVIKHECYMCKKELPRELIGLSNLCWDCDDLLEEHLGESPYEQTLHEQSDSHLNSLKVEYELAKVEREKWKHLDM